MQLIAYQLSPDAPRIRPALPQRAWMDATYRHWAYYCLPLTMANSMGWELLNPHAFSAVWDGSLGTDGLRIIADDLDAPLLVKSHFGYGILTFSPGYLFRTDPQHNLLVRGSPNQGKDGLSPLEGLVETDWLPYAFTMNWQFTRAQHSIRFEAGEPFCFFFPFPRYYLESVVPTVECLSENERILRQHNAWADARRTFNEARRGSASEECKQHFKKDYLRGQTALGDAADQHQTRFHLKTFEA